MKTNNSCSRIAANPSASQSRLGPINQLLGISRQNSKDSTLQLTYIAYSNRQCILVDSSRHSTKPFISQPRLCLPRNSSNHSNIIIIYSKLHSPPRLPA